MNHYTMRKLIAKKIRELYFEGISEKDIELIIKEGYGASSKMINEFIDDAKYLHNKSLNSNGNKGVSR